jgi:hypothetical protein
MNVDVKIYTIAGKQAVCYLQQHEEGMQQQQENCKELLVPNIKFFCKVVDFFILVFLNETINVPQI